MFLGVCYNWYVFTHTSLAKQPLQKKKKIISGYAEVA